MIMNNIPHNCGQCWRSDMFIEKNKVGFFCLRANQFTYDKNSRPNYCPIQELPDGNGYIEDKYCTESEK